MAVVPLRHNVSVGSLPRPRDLLVEQFEEAMANNLEEMNELAATNAYIAESFRK